MAIIDAYASSTISADVNQWSTNRGLPTMSANQFRQVVAPGTYHHPERGLKQDPQGWSGEETLDVSPTSTVAVVRTNFNNGESASAGLNYRLRTMNQTLSLATTPGYDDVTGVGTPASSFLSLLP